MTIGLAGAHRSGKTTLAKDLAHELGMVYHDASVTAQMKAAGYNGVGELSIEERLDAQEKLLDLYLASLSEAQAKDRIVTDRTPLDMIGYALAEVSMHRTSAEIGERFYAYTNRCIRETIGRFDTVILCTPLGTYKEEPGKPPLNRAYQLHVQLIIEGALRSIKGEVNYLLLGRAEREVRLHHSLEFIKERLAELHGEIAEYGAH